MTHSVTKSPIDTMQLVEPKGPTYPKTPKIKIQKVKTKRRGASAPNRLMLLIIFAITLMAVGFSFLATESMWFSLTVGIVFLIVDVYVLLRAYSNREKKKLPRVAEHLLYLVTSEEYRENLVGDLIEEYNEIQARFGECYAKIWFYKQVVASFWPLFRRSVYKMIVTSTTRVKVK